MLVKELSGLLLLGFIVWIFLSPNPDTRIERACSPVQWSGNVATSLAALTTPAFELSVQGGMDKLDYGCQFTIWRLFYQKEYNRYLLAHANAAPTTSAAATDSAENRSSDKSASTSQGINH